MRWIKEKPILLVPLLLLGAFFLLPLLDEEKGSTVKEASVADEAFPSTGFPDYDLLPVELKRRIEKRVAEDSVHRYRFAYFFETDDINRHYYLEDNPENLIVEAMKVYNQEALALVDERLTQNHSGYDIIFHPDYWNVKSAKDARRIRKTVHQREVHYIFPQEEADFRALRVGIFKDTFSLKKYKRLIPNPRSFNLHEVDTSPIPVRGMDYFQDRLRKELKEKMMYLSFYEMQGIVKAEFSIGKGSSSPQIMEGFSTRQPERDEAYKMDGLIVKTLNNLKVRWHPGMKDGQAVNTRMGMSFHFSLDETGEARLNLSDLYPATKVF